MSLFCKKDFTTATAWLSVLSPTTHCRGSARKAEAMSSKTNRLGLTAADISKLKAMRNHDDVEINGASWCKVSDEEEFHVFVIESTEPGRIVKFFRAYQEPSA